MADKTNPIKQGVSSLTQEERNDFYLMDDQLNNFLMAVGMVHNPSTTTRMPIREFQIIGEPGTGKSTAFYHIGKKLNYPVLRIIGQRDMSKEDLFVEKTIREGANGSYIEEVESAFLQNITKRSIILIDEHLTIPPDVMLALNSLLDFEKTITLPNGKQYKRHEENFLVFLSNGKGHAGVKRQHGGFLDRLPTFYMNYSTQEEQILKHKFPNINDDIVLKLVKFANLLRSKNVEEFSVNATTCSTRGLEAIMQMVANGAPVENAVLYALKPEPDEVKTINALLKLCFDTEVTLDNKGVKELNLLRKLEDKVRSYEIQNDVLVKERDYYLKESTELKAKLAEKTEKTNS